MDTIFGLVALLIATALAGAFAFTIHWLFLYVAFALMKPAAAARPAPASQPAPRADTPVTRRMAA